MTELFNAIAGPLVITGLLACIAIVWHRTVWLGERNDG